MADASSSNQSLNYDEEYLEEYHEEVKQEEEYEEDPEEEEFEEGTSSSESEISLYDEVILEPAMRESDPGAFNLVVKFDRIQVLDCTVDCGSSVNIMPSWLHKRVVPWLTPSETCMGHIWAGNQALCEPLGFINYSIEIEGYPIRGEFLVVKPKARPGPRLKVILGRPFLATTKAYLDFERHMLTLNLPNAQLAFQNGGELAYRNPHNYAEKEKVAARRAPLSEDHEWDDWN